MARSAAAQTDAFGQSAKDRGYQESGGEVEKWEAGKEVEGRFVQIIPKQKEDSSPVLVIDTEDGVRQFWCPTILHSRFVGIQADKDVLILCTGQNVKTKRKGGSLAWGFRVWFK